MSTPARRFVRLVAAASLALALGLGTTPALAADEVSVPDPALHACLEAALARQGLPTDLTAANLAALTSALCTGRDQGAISDLTGVEHLTGLQSLQVFDAEVHDISAVAGLSGLKTLLVDSSLPYDLAPLAGLTELTKLGVRLHAGSDTSPLAGLTSLDTLHVWADTAGLPTTEIPASVRTLGISGTPVESISNLRGGSGVRDLHLYTAHLRSLDGVQGMTGLRTLGLWYGGEIDDLQPLAGLTDLTSISLRNNAITDLSPLAGLSALHDLDVSTNAVENLDGLAGLTGLTTLTADANRIRSVEPLAGLTSLTELSLSGNQVSDLSSLAGLPSLTTLNASDNQLSNLGPGGGFTHLTSVALNGNRLTSVSGLAGAPLTSVDLMNNELGDLTPLSGISATATVRLQNNHVKDLSPLPDTITFAATGQDLGTLPDATVGEPYDLGIRDLDGTPLCPSNLTTGSCADSAVTWATSGTRNVGVHRGPDSGWNRFDVWFTQHAGPDRAFARTYAPTLSGGAYVGLSVVLHSKTWTPAPSSRTYSWYRDGKLIAGTDPASGYYEATVTDRGHRLVGCITGHLDGYVDKTRCSAPSARVRTGDVFPSSRPKITGTARTGLTLTATTGRWADGATLHYQWQKNKKNIKGATTATYTLRAGDVGDRIRVRVKGTRPGYHSATRYSKAVTPSKGTLTAPEPTITGEPTVGTTLVAEPGTWAPATVHLAYQWYRDGHAISRANRAQYLLRDADLGHSLTVKVTGSKSGYRTSSRTSPATTPVTASG